ncbi:phosphatase and actin regulator 2 isoform X1 [Misgurnus anguillicaudatus]|uniref:phosphatase and actin regulator 2 isoform X1 n=1 Tax=Misgurnus anguillicaudatus TaxID=75329 RepID=UPI002435613C|nr:phosphatase and actin regulator 2 isoform X1 [Misgurnus anguillicaudatus]
MTEEDEGSFSYIKTFPQVFPVFRFRSQSDTSAFKSRILTRLRQACSVEGLEKSPLANCDVVVGSSQSPQVKGKGKLSSLGKIFKPWKWRKKRTSDKFQDLSKVLERKISTRQTREELIKKGVLIPDQDDPLSTETLNGHAVSSGVTEKVKVDIETPDTVPEEKPGLAPVSEDTEEKKDGNLSPKASESGAPKIPTKKQQVTPPKPSGEASGTGVKRGGQAGTKKVTKGTTKQVTAPSKQTTRNATRGNAKPSNAKKTAGTTKVSTPASGQSSSSTCSKAPKNNSSELTVAQPKSAKKNEPSRSPRPPSKVSSETESSKKDHKKKEVTSNVNKSVEEKSQNGKGAKGHPSEPSSEQDKKQPPHVNEETEETSFTRTLNELSSETSEKTVNTESETEKERTTGDQTQKTEEGEKPQSVNVESPEVTIIPDTIRENQANDSDSDGPILYRDDDEEDEDDEDDSTSSLANKIRRRDTLAIKLGNRPSKKELEEKNILPRTSETERLELRQQIGSKLVRRLSQRPTTEELEQRNILKQKNLEEEHEAKQEIKRRLSRKLSVRPTVAELVARRILRFNEYVEVTDAKDYDRRADKPWTRLTPADKAAIRKELNEFKSKEMEVHEESKQFTRFHRP